MWLTCLTDLQMKFGFQRESMRNIVSLLPGEIFFSEHLVNVLVSSVRLHHAAAG
jgi:hypothetical protein